MEILGKIIAIVGLVFLVAILLALPTMYLWNWLMPLIFGLTKLTFWEALGINLLSSILFKSSNSSSEN